MLLSPVSGQVEVVAVTREEGVHQPVTARAAATQGVPGLLGRPSASPSPCNLRVILWVYG